MARKPKAVDVAEETEQPKARAPGKLAAAPGTHGLNELATLLEISPQWFLGLVRKNYIPREDKGRYNLVAAVRGYIRYLKDEERRSSKSAAQSAVQKERAAEIKQRREREARTLIDYDEAQGVLDDVVGIYRSELSGLPAACTRDLTLRSAIEAQVDETQGRVHAALRERLSALRSGGSAVPPGAEDDA